MRKPSALSKAKPDTCIIVIKDDPLITAASNIALLVGVALLVLVNHRHGGGYWFVDALSILMVIRFVANQVIAANEKLVTRCTYAELEKVVFRNLIKRTQAEARAEKANKANTDE
jgi:hypothetical protein